MVPLSCPLCLLLPTNLSKTPLNVFLSLAFSISDLRFECRWEGVLTTADCEGRGIEGSRGTGGGGCGVFKTVSDDGITRVIAEA